MTTAEDKALIHTYGAMRHPEIWLEANLQAVTTLLEFGSSLTLHPDTDSIVPIIMLRVLDVVRTSNGEKWNAETFRWEKA